MPLSISQMASMSRLLDEALPLDEAGRRAWLHKLAPEHQDLAQALRESLLPENAQISSFEKLSTLPRLGAIAEKSAIVASGLQPGARVGPYELIRLLGTGGMAEVWLARRADGAFKREVALKLPMLTWMRQDLEQRFVRERDILASLEHPNIARLYDAGIDPQGLPYFALEYVVGTPITTYCDEQRLSIAARLELFRQVLSAVQYAHANLVIHRDLKPANILVTAERQVKLLDFGIAKLLSEGEARETELTQLSGRALTPDYAAPEQIAGAPITTATDVYALGVMLYELLSGQRPYVLRRDSRGALEEAILQAEPMAPSRVLQGEGARARGTSIKKLQRDLKGDLDTVVFKALKKSPSERYATAAAFGEDISRHLHGEVVLAQRDTLAYRLAKFTRRHWIAIGVASLLLLTLTGGLIATAYEAKIASAEARIASAQRDAALQAQSRALTQAADARLREGDVATASGIIFEVLRPQRPTRSYTAEGLNVFQEARSADLQVLAMTGHTDGVRRAVFSPDGRQIVTASFDKSARIWDAATGRQLLVLTGHTDRVNSAAFSPDGKQIVTASRDKSARIWDAAMGRQLLLLTGHTDRVDSAAFSADGKQIVTASDDRSARIWDAATGRQLKLLTGHTARVYCAVFSPNGKQIVTTSEDKSARIWDAATGKQLRLLAGHTARVYSAVFSPDGRQIVTASEDKSARIWDAATGKQLLLLTGHTDEVSTATFSADGEQIVTSSIDKSARIWDAATGRQLLLLSGHTAGVLSAAFSPDGRQIVTASFDTSARIWDAAMGGQQLLLTGHTDPVASAAFSADGRRIITASFDNSARIWDSATGQQLLTWQTAGLYTAAFSPDGKQIVTASQDKSARIWDAATGRQLLLLAGHTDWVTSAAFSPDGKQVVTASRDKSARIWDAATGKQLLLLTGHTNELSTAAFSADGKQLVTASWDKSARIWDAATGRQLQLLTGHTDWIYSAAFSPDGKRIVTASKDKSARIWNAATGKQLLLLAGHSDELSTAAFSADGTRIVTASLDKSARIWDAATGRQLKLLSGHTDWVISAAFSPDGRRIVTASEDKSARIWQARVPPLETQIVWAEAAQFDPLPATERFQLGLPAPTDVRAWPADGSKCDESAAAPYDPDRHAPGVMIDQLVADVALTACAADRRSPGSTVQSGYQHARALVASGNFAAARQEFEQALAAGYRSAAVDLAMLLSQPAAGMLDAPRATALYQQASKRGVMMAAFELGSLYEHGVRGTDDSSYLLAPDSNLSWSWYQKAAAAGEPNALARFAQRADSTAASEQNTVKRNSSLLESFKYYAAAAETARREDWPDDAWKNWRYRRASLAHVLERQGMMQEVADAYDGVRTQSK
jgi:WD40 repeat protein/serine/threonine protein kinase/TPR repeat protein